MLSVKAVYDGKELKFDENISINSPQAVIITFLDEPVQQITSSIKSFAFLEDAAEDIYSDDDLKIRY